MAKSRVRACFANCHQQEALGSAVYILRDCCCAVDHSKVMLPESGLVFDKLPESGLVFDKLLQYFHYSVFFCPSVHDLKHCNNGEKDIEIVHDLKHCNNGEKDIEIHIS